MAFLEWDEQLDVRVDAMNDQHKALIGLMNDLYDLHRAGAPKPRKLALARDLAALAARHFRAEEKYMGSIRYDGLDRHRRIHETLEKTLQHHLAEIERPDGEFGDQFFYFLKSWLRSHIAGIDTKYAKAALAS